MRGFVLVNESTDPALTRDRVVAIAGELAKQQAEVASYWQGAPLDVVFADSEAAAPNDGDWTLAKIVDTLSDPEDLAFHTTTASGRPLILIGARIIKANVPAGADWIGGPDSIATAASHELAETRVNPYVSFYAPLNASTWIPLEICDPTQGDAYEVTPGSGIHLANFVGPRYFSIGAGPYDRMGVVQMPGEIRRGGYQEQLTGGPGGTSQSVFGALARDGGMPEWKRVAKGKPGSRRSRIVAAWAKGTDALTRARAELEVATTVAGRYAGKVLEQQKQIDQMRAAWTERETKIQALLEQVWREAGGGR